ncbi:hypothetical protein M8494_11815 [Serratia ureilytica]
MSHQALGIDLSKVERLSVPNILHFVWIGDLNEVNTHYIDIWEKQTKISRYSFGMTKTLPVPFAKQCHTRFRQRQKIKNKVKAELKIKIMPSNIYIKNKDRFFF